MSGNLCLLTVLFIMCCFIKKGRSVVYTTITRDSNRDYFTDVCKNCYKYGAVLNQGVCKCESPSFPGLPSFFLRSEKHCTSEKKFMLDEHCQRWERAFIEVIDTEKKDSEYTFYKESGQSSCQLEPLISYRNGTTGEWQFFNLSGNVLALHTGPSPGSSLKIKVTQVSPSLTNFKGHVMKLGLKCIKRSNGKTEESCLLFKAKGEIRFPLNCSVSVYSTTPSLTAPTITRTIVTATTAPTIPTIIVTPTITCTLCTTTSTPVPEPNGTTTLTPAIIVAIVIGGTVLCLSIICAFWVVYRYTYICRSRGLQARNPDNDFDVISNPGPQTYRIQEEPLYVEVPDIYPCDKGSACSSSNQREERPSVLLNPYVNEARFLPSRPELAGNTRTLIDAGPVYQNDGSEAMGEAAADSMVFKNPRVEEASSSSLPGSKNDVTKLSGAHEQDEESVGDHHHHHVVDDTYQGLVKGKRTQSVFVCPSCNDNPVYQRLSTPRNCPHGANDKTKENRASFYESLSGLERGSRESVYARPSCIPEEPGAEDKGNRNSEEGEGLPEYYTLEPEETVSKEDLDEPVNHDYNVLEGPKETGDEVQVDERAKDRICDPDRTSEDSDLSLEPSKGLHIEDNPAYAKPWKAKEKPELPLETSDFLNIENNPTCSKPWRAKEDPEMPLKPSDFLNIENNPAYSTPWRTKTAESCLRKRAYSM